VVQEGEARTERLSRSAQRQKVQTIKLPPVLVEAFEPRKTRQVEKAGLGGQLGG
jgi:hypothetical protein